MKTISVPYEEVDHQSRSNVNVKVSAAPISRPQTGNCGINFSMNGDQFQATNTCTEYVAFTNMIKNERNENGVRVTDYGYAIKLYDIQTIFSALNGGLQEMHVNGNELMVKTGSLNRTQNFTLKLYVQRKRFFKNDEVLIDRVLTNNEFSYEPIDENTGWAHIDLNRVLNGFNANRRHIIKLNLDVNLDSGTMLNQMNIPNLHQENTITIN
jgi:hypothetical protein